VTIRTYQPGDETVQVAIYNEAAADLPKFKPAIALEVLRRVSAVDFDPALRFYALENGQPRAYVVCNKNGRISFPWCKKGSEHLGAELFQHAVEAMKERGYKTLNAAYRADWTPVLSFFKLHGFTVVRDMVNFVIDLVDMPTSPARRGAGPVPLQRGDVPALFALAPRLLRCHSAEELEAYLFRSPYFPPESVFVLRDQRTRAPRAAGVLVQNPTYADPKKVDAAMPCYRLGAFGAEGMDAKRIKGMFSVLCADDPEAAALGTELMGHAATLVEDGDDITALAAQVPSDATNLLRFYQLKFQRQGAFPVLERAL
jgi:hypothetical protein